VSGARSTDRFARSAPTWSQFPAPLRLNPFPICSSLPSGHRLPSALPRYSLSDPVLPGKPCSHPSSINLMQLLTSNLLFPLRYGTL
jgi:hypothetical protein